MRAPAGHPPARSYGPAILGDRDDLGEYLMCGTFVIMLGLNNIANQRQLGR